MSKLQEIAAIPLSLSPSPFASPDGGSHADSRQFDCHGLWYKLALFFPSALFVVFLLSQARRSFTKLFHGRSHIMIVYYALLWLVSILNLMWCSLQVIWVVDFLLSNWISCFAVSFHRLLVLKFGSLTPKAPQLVLICSSGSWVFGLCAVIESAGFCLMVLVISCGVHWLVVLFNSRFLGWSLTSFQLINYIFWVTDYVLVIHLRPLN